MIETPRDNRYDYERRMLDAHDDAAQSTARNVSIQESTELMRFFGAISRKSE